MSFIHPDYTRRKNKQMKHTLIQMINKWVTEEHLNDQALGEKVRHWFWRNEKTTEHWLNEGEMSGYGYDDASSYSEDVGLSGQELDDIYGPI